MRTDGNLGILRSFIRAANPSELLDLTRAGLLIQALRIALLGNLDGHVDIDLDEGDGDVAVGGSGSGSGVEVAGELAVGAEGGDEGGDGDLGAVGEQLGDLADAADVLLAVGVAEAEVLVQPEAHVVAVEAVRGDVQVQQVLL